MQEPNSVSFHFDLKETTTIFINATSRYTTTLIKYYISERQKQGKLTFLISLYSSNCNLGRLESIKTCNKMYHEYIVSDWRDFKGTKLLLQ